MICEHLKYYHIGSSENIFFKASQRIFFDDFLVQRYMYHKKTNVSTVIEKYLAHEHKTMCPTLADTVEPRFNEPLFNEVLDIMNNIISISRPKLQYNVWKRTSI